MDCEGGGRDALLGDVGVGEVDSGVGGVSFWGLFLFFFLFFFLLLIVGGGGWVFGAEAIYLQTQDYYKGKADEEY